MRCQILHESPGRIRIDTLQSYMTIDQADHLEYYLNGIPGVTDASVSRRTRHAVIQYETDRETVLSALSAFDYDETPANIPENTGRELAEDFEEQIVRHVVNRFVTRIILPVPVRSVITIAKSGRFLLAGLKAILQGKLEVSVLDALTIGISMIRGDFDTAGDVMFLLGLSEILEDYTYRKSVDELARSLALNVDTAWYVQEGQPDRSVPISMIHENDQIRVHAGSIIPLDGIVVHGEAEVNQASMTGESLAVRKFPGAYVYAGTVVESGECIFAVQKEAGSGRYDRIVNMIEDSEKLKSSAESKAASLSDRLVPYSLGGTILTYALTRNVNQALAVLMVDYSCALKLCIPIAVLSAMREAGDRQISVKGGKFLEAAAKADTIVFDKTGTLTMSEPKVADIIPFGSHDPMEMLRIAACLEEHFPHSIANAVTREAEKRGLLHEEMHSEVEYVVAHGIVSHIGRKRALIGSYHFIFEDEHCSVPVGEEEKFASLPDDYSHLYLSIGKRLAAVLLIEDPIRPEAPDVIQRLHEAGFTNIVMMTGDSARTAHRVAQQLGIDTCYAEVLPEDKAAYVRKQKEAGHTVIMIGDGINDAPALAEADVSIAISEGAAIARQVADITIARDSLYSLIELRTLSTQLSSRLSFNYRYIIGVNSILIACGAAGILQPSVTAYIHNLSTLALCLKSMTDLSDDRSFLSFRCMMEA